MDGLFKLVFYQERNSLKIINKKIPSNKYVSKKNLEIIVLKLLEEKKQLASSKERIDLFEEIKIAADPLDSATLATLALQEVKVSTRNISYLKKINTTLEKILKGNYGQCIECDEKISTERLMARPTADLCIKCKEEQEREERERK